MTQEDLDEIERKAVDQATRIGLGARHMSAWGARETLRAVCEQLVIFMRGSAELKRRELAARETVDKLSAALVESRAACDGYLALSRKLTAENACMSGQIAVLREQAHRREFDSVGYGGSA